MDYKRNCAERMRPILQAMERSIDAARRNRIQPAVPAASIPAPAQPFQIKGAIPFQNAPAPAADENPQRMKARAKRLDSPINPY